MYNKYFLYSVITTFAFLFSINPIIAQEENFIPHGKVYARVFSDFEVGILGEDKRSAFEVSQAYLGYKYQMSQHFSGEIKLDIGSPNDLSEYSKLRRYAYFKLAALRYKNNRLTIRFGIIGMRQFNLQEKFWTRKYIKQSYQDFYKFGPSADLGAAISYELIDNLTVDALIMNGEGYNKLQYDNIYKNGYSITYLPSKEIYLKLYTDFTKDKVWQKSYSGFIGYNKKEKYSIGVEYNYQTNHGFEDYHDFWGTSVYSSVVIKKKFELFARYDLIDSETMDGQNQAWNEPHDGQHFIGGIQFQPIKKVKLAVDLQYWLPSIDNIEHQLTAFFHTSYDM